MTEIPISYFLLASAALFATGFTIMILKRNAIFMLMGIELMLNAANLNLIAFSRQDDGQQGLMLGIFVLVVGVCEMAIALSIILHVYRQFQHIEVGKFESHD
jgi:NADH-quinone oxidoreductase subunit K